MVLYVKRLITMENAVRVGIAGIKTSRIFHTKNIRIIIMRINPLEFYIDYVNNYLTAQGIADAYNIGVFEAVTLIRQGRALNNAQS